MLIFTILQTFSCEQSQKPGVHFFEKVTTSRDGPKKVQKQGSDENTRGLCTLLQKNCAEERPCIKDYSTSVASRGYMRQI